MNRDDWRPPPAKIHGEQQNDALPSRTAACCQPHGHSQQTPAVTHAERYVQNLSGLSAGEYSPQVCDSPAASVSDESMDVDHDHPSNLATPPRDNTGATAERIGRLSLDHSRPQDGSPGTPRGRGQLGTYAASSIKRRASQEPPGRPSPQLHCSTGTRQVSGLPRNAPRTQRHARPDSLGHHRVTSGEQLQRRMIEAKSCSRPFVQSHNRLKQQPVRGDSGYCSNNPTRANTGLLVGNNVCPFTGRMPPIGSGNNKTNTAHFPKSIIPLPASTSYPSLILQPESSPISQEQLAAEVKGIYAGLVMVEAKCINIDAAQAADPRSQLGSEQWQALHALHRTLLYEHHDFLMATQHPSATPALRGLAAKYSMPARLWKHGIHAFLEVLRHRRPASQDYMLAFICLAYQMTALLYETVPAFTDTWIECLGDLARYRMAIEEEKGAHVTWGDVAARWYAMASDRHPSIGRLYHHLGILERPSLRKFCFYAKSLTCVIPFPNARDSLSTLCKPIVHDKHTIQSSKQSAEARIVTFHALIYSGKPQETIDEVGADALDLLRQQPSKLNDIGAHLAITNTSALCQFGAPTNDLFQQYMDAVGPSNKTAVQPMSGTCDQGTQTSPALVSEKRGTSYESTKSFWNDCFELVLQSHSRASTTDFLPFLHVMLVALHSLHSLQVRFQNLGSTHQLMPLVDIARAPWTLLASFLNILARQEAITAWLLECARQGNFLTPEHQGKTQPLSEDYWIRGLVWGQFYFCPGWFDGQGEDDGRAIETPITQQARLQRVLWLGLYLAFHTEYLQYDVQNKVFSACSATGVSSSIMAPVPVETIDACTEQPTVTPSPGSRSTTGRKSSGSNSEDDFVHVEMPGMLESPSRLGAKADARNSVPSPPRKHKSDLRTFKVADENGKVWSAEGEGEY